MSTPELKWAQRVDKVFITFECLDTKNVSVELTDGLMSLKAEGGGKTYNLENMALWLEIDAAESKWFRNDRCAAAPARALSLSLSLPPARLCTATARHLPPSVAVARRPEQLVP